MNIQKDVADLEKEIFKRTGKSEENPYFLLSNLSAEVGELCDEVIGIEGERIEDRNYNDKSETAKEIVDVVMNALRLANHYDIDFEEYWEKRLKGLHKKFSE